MHRSWAAARRLAGGLRRRLRRLPVPIGALATDRRLLRDHRRVLGGAVLVVGDPVAAVRALAPSRPDVLGTDPYDDRITVLSDGRGPDAVPAGRWSGVVVVDPHPTCRDDLLAAATVACRPGGTVLVLENSGPRQRRLRSYPT
jgi:hypothetical protein